jgi:hypothetical protein
MAEAYQFVPEPDRDAPSVPEPPANNFDAAKAAYRKSLPEEYVTLSQQVLVSRFGINKREAAQVQSEVKAELEPQRTYEPATVPSQNGSGPA